MDRLLLDAGLAALRASKGRSDEEIVNALFLAFQNTSIARSDDVISTNVAATLSRWPGVAGLKIKEVAVLDEDMRVTHTVRTGRNCALEVVTFAEEDGTFSPTISILVMTRDGIDVTRLLGGPFPCELCKGATQAFRVSLTPLLLLPGRYVFSVGLFKHYDPNDTSTAVRYEILGRSFELNVVGTVSEVGLMRLNGTWSSTVKSLSSQTLY